MSWHLFLSTVTLLVIAVALVGIVATVIFGQSAQIKRRVTAYKKSGRFRDLLKAFYRY